MSRKKKKVAPQAHAPGKTAHTNSQLQPDWAIIVLAGAGMLITAYLAALAWFSGPTVLCAEGSGCDVVRQSRWSTLLGLPIAVWGFAVYALLAGLAWRMPARLKRWRRLWFLALVGTAISIYLTVIAMVVLDASCPWCLLSLAVISTIFVVLIFRRPDSAPGMPWPHWLARSGGLALAVVAAMHIWYSGWLSHPDTARLQALAAHLEISGAQYYGAWWCGECQEQKRLFRGAAEQLPFIECSTGGRGGPMTLRCREQGIEVYPTWVIGQRHYTGAIAPRDLAQFSGFDWDGFSATASSNSARTP